MTGDDQAGIKPPSKRHERENPRFHGAFRCYTRAVSRRAPGCAPRASQSEGESQLEYDRPETAFIADQPLRQTIAQLADPHHHSGGGAAAAITLAAAAACAEMVVSLASRRKSLAPRRAEVEAILGNIRDLLPQFLAAIDRDVAVLDALLDAQRTGRAARTSLELEQALRAEREALLNAARTPLGLAGLALDLLRQVRAALPFATRFTVSDLGAAAELAQGAIESALLMSDVNLVLLGDEPAAVPIRSAVSRTRQDAPAIASEVLHLTRAMIAGALPEEAGHGTPA